MLLHLIDKNAQCVKMSICKKQHFKETIHTFSQRCSPISKRTHGEYRTQHLENNARTIPSAANQHFHAHLLATSIKCCWLLSSFPCTGKVTASRTSMFHFGHPSPLIWNRSSGTSLIHNGLGMKLILPQQQKSLCLRQKALTIHGCINLGIAKDAPTYCQIRSETRD